MEKINEDMQSELKLNENKERNLEEKIEAVEERNNQIIEEQKRNLDEITDIMERSHQESMILEEKLKESERIRHAQRQISENQIQDLKTKVHFILYSFLFYFDCGLILI